jgi:hypothetical protein
MRDAIEVRKTFRCCEHDEANLASELLLATVRPYDKQRTTLPLNAPTYHCTGSKYSLLDTKTIQADHRQNAGLPLHLP